MNSTSWAKLVRAMVHPEIAVRQIVRRLSIGSLDFRLSFKPWTGPNMRLA